MGKDEKECAIQKYIIEQNTNEMQRKYNNVKEDDGIWGISK